MELNGEPKQLKTQQKDAKKVQERMRDMQWREKKSENAWVVLKQATPRRF